MADRHIGSSGAVGHRLGYNRTICRETKLVQEAGGRYPAYYYYYYFV